jgi:hypothetical protein
VSLARQHHSGYVRGSLRRLQALHQVHIRAAFLRRILAGRGQLSHGGSRCCGAQVGHFGFACMAGKGLQVSHSPKEVLGTFSPYHAKTKRQSDWWTILGHTGPLTTAIYTLILVFVFTCQATRQGISRGVASPMNSQPARHCLDH